MKTLSKIYMALVLMFLYVPIFVLIVFSFNETKSRSVFSGFTLDWYIKLFRNEVIISSLMNTIIIAVIASIAATVLGTLAAIGINSMRKVPKAVVMNITNMPIVNPEIVTGVSLMLLFVFFAARMNLEFGFVTLVIAHITFDVPYVILNVMPKFRQMDPNLFEAAQDLGCGPFTALRKVILHPRRHLGIDFAADHPVGFERPQGDGQHAVRNVAQRAVDLAETHHAVGVQRQQHQHRPLVPQPAQDIPDGTTARGRKIPKTFFRFHPFGIQQWLHACNLLIFKCVLVFAGDSPYLCMQR